jgi:hypothetical protein
MIADLDIPNCCPAAELAEQEYIGLLKPSRKQIAKMIERTFNQIWHARHLQLGRPEPGEKSATAIASKYPKESLVMCDDCILRAEGSLGALRWVLYGAFIENYDT